MTRKLVRRSLVTGIGVALMLPVTVGFATSQLTEKRQGQRSQTMSANELREFFERYIDVLNTHEMDRMTEFVHEEIIQNRKSVTRDKIILELKGHVDAVPDFKWRVEDIVVEGDTVAARLFNIGTPRKTWLGLEPTGATIETLEFAFHKVRDGRFYEQNYAIDVLGAQQQLAR